MEKTDGGLNRIDRRRERMGLQPSDSQPAWRNTFPFLILAGGESAQFRFQKQADFRDHSCTQTTAMMNTGVHNPFMSLGDDSDTPGESLVLFFVVFLNYFIPERCFSFPFAPFSCSTISSNSYRNDFLRHLSANTHISPTTLTPQHTHTHTTIASSLIHTHQVPNSSALFSTFPSMHHNYHIAAHCTLCHLLAAHTCTHNHTLPDARDLGLIPQSYHV